MVIGFLLLEKSTISTSQVILAGGYSTQRNPLKVCVHAVAE